MKKIFTLAAAVLASVSMWADVDLKQGASYDFTTITADAFAGLETSNAYWSSNTDYYQNNKYQPTEATAFLLTSTGTEIAGFEGLKCITGSSSGRVRIYTNGNGLYFNSNNAKLVFPAVEKDQIIIVRYANVSSDEAKFALTNATQSQDVTNHVDTVKVSADGDVTLTYNSKKFYIKTIDVIANVKSPILKSIKIAGIDCEIVKAADAADPDTIKGELPFGTVVADAVAAITTDDFVLGGTATSLRVPYPYTSVYARDDDGNEKEYFIACTVNATVSTDATLKSLSLNNIAVVLEDAVFEYNVELPYAAIVEVAAVANDAAAQGVVADLSVDGVATITVTAQAGNTQEYVVNYTILPAKKDLLEAAFSNGAKGAITDGKIRVPYLASEEEPTFTSAKFWNADGEPTAVVEGTNLKVTGIDGVDSLYALEFVALTPAAVAYDTEITFDSTETYIFSTYGFGKYIKDSDYRGWKFAKAVEEANNKRISDGRARLYFALPAADSLILVSGTGGERGIKVYVNGVENTTVTKTAKNNESIVLKDLRPDAANFIAIESNQTGGDGGFIKMQLGKPTTTALDNTDAAVKAEKVIREGQVLIIRDGKTFNVLGARVR